MNAALAQACTVFFYAVAPGLLAIRYCWPRILPRWGVLLAAAGLGGAAFYLREMLYVADMLEVVQRFGGFEHTMPIVGEGMVMLENPRKSDFMFGAVLELVYLLLWLVPYGIVQILRSRRKRASEAIA